ncbi:HAMP domain-containing protein [candidate division KSB1 bacterium]|nr:HAMP domain-containing protein [candidate division KSB1 bacterium]
MSITRTEQPKLDLFHQQPEITRKRNARELWRKLKATVARGGEIFRTLCQQIFHRSKNHLKTFPIQFKLSLILTSLVLVIVTILNIFVLQHEKRILRERLDELCLLNIKSLASSIPGYLLIEDIAPIAEAVFRTQKAGISGLKSIAVIDRSGKIVASSLVTNFTDSVIAPGKSAWLMELDRLTRIESETEYEYYHPIYIEQQKLGIVEFRFSKANLHRPVVEAQQMILKFTSIIVLLAIIGIYFLSKKMVMQIQALSEGAKQVAQGNLDVQIQIHSNDELGQLSHEFNYMVIGLREKLQMQKFVSKATIRMIKEYSGAPIIQRRSHKQYISVLFSDVRKFSQVAENHSPEEVVELINIYLDLQARIIEQNNGIIDKFVGDQVMGVFEGKSHENFAQQAAVGMQKAIRELNRKRITQKKIILEVGIGLNNGDAVIGNMGSQERMDYTVVGSTVNLGHHLCANAKPRQIIASQSFIEKIDYYYPIIKLDPIPIKGRIRPVKVYEIDYNHEL